LLDRAGDLCGPKTSGAVAAGRIERDDLGAALQDLERRSASA